MPTAGGIYYWSSKLGGPGWGWFTGWFNLIGLVAVVRVGRSTSAATFLMYALGLYEVHFIFDFATRAEPPLHRARQVRAVRPDPAPRRLVNVFRSHLVTCSTTSRCGGTSRRGWRSSCCSSLSPPTTPASPTSSVTRPTNQGFKATRQRDSVSTCCRRVPADDVHDHRLRRFRSHLRGDTWRRKSAPRDLAFGPLLGGLRLDRAAGDHVRDSAATKPRSTSPASRPRRSSRRRSASPPQGRDPDLDRRAAVLRDGLRDSASRMTFAFSRDGAVPGHNLWRRLGKSQTPLGRCCSWSCSRSIITIPAYFPNHLGEPRRLPGGDLDLGDRALHRLHDSRLSALAPGRFVPGGPVDAREEVQMDQPDRRRVGRVVRDHLLAAVLARGVPWESAFSWNAVNYAPLVTIAVILAVTIWYFASAKRTFKGPVRTIDELDMEQALPAIAESPGARAAGRSAP